MSEPDKTLYLATDSRTSIPVYQWQPDNTPKAILHISHGMAEYGRRYHVFARELNKAGFIVYAHDHPGHGERIEMDKENIQGHFADQYGWSSAIHDVALTVNHIKRRTRNYRYSFSVIAWAVIYCRIIWSIVILKLTAQFFPVPIMWLSLYYWLPA